MADEESAPSGSLEDPDVSAQDAAVPDPSGARQDPGTQGAIDDARSLPRTTSPTHSRTRATASRSRRRDRRTSSRPLLA